MRVKILHSRRGLVEKGREFNYPDDFALDLIKNGLAEKVETFKSKSKPEPEKEDSDHEPVKRRYNKS